MATDNNMEKPENKFQDQLVDVVFSWSLTDVLNKNLYKDKVEEIPKTFSSVSDYTKSFIYPLIEETHADLLSKILGVNGCPTSAIKKVQKSKGFKLPKRLLYTVVLTRREGFYVPEVGDLIALTDVKPKSVGDLKRPNKSYLIALVQGMEITKSKYKLFVLSSKPINQQEGKGDIEKDDSTSYSVEDVKHFAVYLTNLTTNIRISRALSWEIQGDKLKMIKTVLRVDFPVEERCAKCSDTTRDLTSLKMMEALKSFQLDNSQEAAVLSCLDARKCRHQNTIQLIWGPPGTGKTKTVGSLLCMLLRMKCRTLTCAPTNIAVLGVAKRVMSLLRDSLPYNVYGLGDVVLFGNRERMKIDDCKDVLDIFLNDRVEILADCLAPLSGWKGISEWMIRFLDDPEVQYQLYKKENLEGDEGERDDKDEKKEDMADSSQVKEAMKKKKWKTLIQSTLKGEKSRSEIPTKVANELPSKQKSDKTNFQENIMTYEQFVTKGFGFLENRLVFCIENLCIHMPTCFISLEAVEQMIGLVRSLKRFGRLMKQIVDANVELRKAMNGSRAGGMSNYCNLHGRRMSILKSLRYLQKALRFPNFKDNSYIKRFCLQNAGLIFCTSSSSINLHTKKQRPLEFLVIDEAAQLKECESLIPLQLEGLRHAILVGDEKQLPAMVQSKISEEAEFGRSLFERLASLGHKKHLLNVQYRMHPFISQFPNREFYDKQVLDGVNVTSVDYGKRFFQGSMYGPYSFINVTSGKEEFDRNQSRKNLMEVAIAAEIVASLFKESVARKRHMSVGCISPYKAQVTAIQEKLGNKYKGFEKLFSVNIRSVDGFQGSEEDVIIISTVRCNGNGSVGFLSNHQRTNVALTRARYRLLILGNGSTLINSGSIWKNLVVDAKDRGCFFNASEDRNLVQAVLGALIELRQYDSIFNMDSMLFTDAKWQVKFSDMFLDRIGRFFNPEICKEVAFLLVKLSSGWRQPQKNGNAKVNIEGKCPLLVNYKVTQNLRLIWAVDIVVQNSLYIQVLKIWDILPAVKIGELAKILMQKVYGNYTETMMSRCKEECVDGNLTLPITWPVNSETDPNWSLANQLAALSLRNQPTSSSSSRTRNGRWGFGNTNSINYGYSKSHGRGNEW